MIKFIHIRQANTAKGGTTIAYRFNAETRIAEFVVGKCNSNETYCKRIGRAVTGGRLNKGKRVQQTFIPEGHGVADIVARTVLDVVRA